MLAPATGLLAVFIVVPMLLTIWLSFQSWSTQTGFDTARFIGVQNFIDLFSNSSIGRDFKAALVNTAVYTGLSVVFILPLSVLFGLLVHQKLAPGGIALRTILFSTYMVPMIAIALVFSKLYSPTEGPLNQILGWIGIPAQSWLSAPQTALGSIVVLNVWQQVGYFTVLAVAGLTQIPDTLYEAAKIDGANPLQRFFSITLPHLYRFMQLGGGLMEAAIDRVELRGAAVVAGDGALAGFHDRQQRDLRGRAVQADTALHPLLCFENAVLHQVADHLRQVRGRFSEHFRQPPGRPAGPRFLLRQQQQGANRGKGSFAQHGLISDVPDNIYPI